MRNERYLILESKEYGKTNAKIEKGVFILNMKIIHKYFFLFQILKYVFTFQFMDARYRIENICIIQDINIF